LYTKCIFCWGILYYKLIIYGKIVPNKAVEEAGLSENDELEIKVSNDKKRTIVKGSREFNGFNESLL